MSRSLTHPLTHSVHKFFIPVMGTGFTIDTPLKVARFGISSVISLVDDVLIEQMRRRLSGESGRPYEEITDKDDDPRARRITAYLNLMQDLVNDQVQRLRGSLFNRGGDLSGYFEMLPPSPLRTLYDRMRKAANPFERIRLQKRLRQYVTAGGIDVNIMTKLDRLRTRAGSSDNPTFSDALSALRGYANSRLRSSLVLSAGLNQRLYAYLREFPDFFPDETGDIRKRIVLKVSDFRSALIQGKLLAKNGLWVSEYRVESGLNCGGHAFGGDGSLMGPILEEFRRRREDLTEQLQEVWCTGLERLGRTVPDRPPTFRVTVQGGLGTAEENDLLTECYGVDGLGWGSPFLFVPDVVNIDSEHLARLQAAGEADVQLSDASPLGVPFWSLTESASEQQRRQRIADGKPGSSCPKGYLVSNTEFTTVPICTASRAYQRRKLATPPDPALNEAQQEDERRRILAKACICHDLAGGATMASGLDREAHTAVCCGPNTVYFSRVARLKEMVDHIYGRSRLPLSAERPHVFLKELSLNLDRLRGALARHRQGLAEGAADSTRRIKQNLQAGITYYQDLAEKLVADQRAGFRAKLEALRAELDKLGS